MRTLARLSDGALWASTPNRGLVRWATPTAEKVADPEVNFEAAGLPEKHGWMRIVEWQGALCVSTNQGLFRWEPRSGRFAPLPVARSAPGEGSYNLYGGDPDYLWSFWGKNRGVAHLVRIKPDGTSQALPGQIVQALGDVEVLWTERHEGREILWAGGTFGLARVDLAEAFQVRSDFAALFGEVRRQQEPVWGDGALVWPHGRADLTVQFGATTYRSGANLQFQNWLEGYDRDWSDWSATDARSFTNLAAGRYTLHLRARDADGRGGREAAFSFVVMPPWWKTPWAYVGYAIAGMLLVRGAIGWRVRASERERERLQRLVAERTVQLAESQQSLLQAKEAAEAANRAKSAFLANMSHELRTPLNSVLGYAQILRRSPDVAPGARRALDTIQRSGDHLLHLINEVLDLAKVEAGRIELHEATFSLAEFAESVTELFAVRAAEKSLGFSGPDASGLPLAVLGDEPRLRQVLLNLLGNAFKFTERGEVRWLVRAGESGVWRFEVADTGVGISPEEQRRVFEPFYQSSERPGLARQGTGLGLSISRHLVELMGGRLRLESAPGRGTRFWFEIPLRFAEAPAAAVAVPLELSPTIGYRGRPRRLLVVDDERTNRAILEEMLAPLGFEIVEADGAAAARRLVAQQAPDAVLLDLRMPGDDGFALAREWRASGALLGAKVVALSASVLPEQQAEALGAGCDAFLAKPFREEQLLRLLGSLLDLEWVRSGAPESGAAPAAEAGSGDAVRWESGTLQRLLQLAEHGDALRLGEELRVLANRGAVWAAAVAPWQKLAGGYQMEALSRAIAAALGGAGAVGK
ncbi:hypothetical protein DB347_06370 [Opitutaceae bacterium EW11]|nr:hypothetical protein DB347_06370 [Opitutaceae bacterium EW11]